MALELSCTRAEADQKQLMRCRNILNTTSELINSVGKVLALAGNETRLKILFLLNEEGELCPCDFSDILQMSVPAISQHIRKMKDAGINFFETRWSNVVLLFGQRFKRGIGRNFW